jgi:hypothetical protein
MEGLSSHESERLGWLRLKISGFKLDEQIRWASKYHNSLIQYNTIHNTQYNTMIQYNDTIQYNSLMQYNEIQYNTIQYNTQYTIQYNTTPYNDTIQHNTMIQYNDTIKYNIVQYNTIQQYITHTSCSKLLRQVAPCQKTRVIIKRNIDSGRGQVVVKVGSWGMEGLSSHESERLGWLRLKISGFKLDEQIRWASKYHNSLIQYNTIHNTQYNTMIQYNDTIQYNTIQFIDAIQWNTIQYNTQYNTIQYNTIQWYNTTQHNDTIQYKMIQYNTTQYNIVQYNTTTIHNTYQLLKIIAASCSMSEDPRHY